MKINQSNGGIKTQQSATAKKNEITKLQNQKTTKNKRNEIITDAVP